MSKRRKAANAANGGGAANPLHFLNCFVIDNNTMYSRKLEETGMFREADQALDRLFQTWRESKGAGRPRQGPGPAHKPLIYSAMDEFFWPLFVGIDAPRDPITPSWMQEFLARSDLGVLRERAASRWQEQRDGDFFTVQNINVQIKREHPLWWIPLQMYWVDKQPPRAAPSENSKLAKFNSYTYTYQNYVYEMLMMIRALNPYIFPYEYSESRGRLSLVNALAYSDESMPLKTTFMRYFYPHYKLFLLHKDNVQWGLYNGVPEALAREDPCKILVPKYVNIVDMTGELCARDSLEANDPYAITVLNPTDRGQGGLRVGQVKPGIATTNWRGLSKPLTGSAGFFVNASCSADRLLMCPVRHKLLREHEDQEEAPKTPINGLRTFGIFMDISTNHDITGADFLGPRRSEGARFASMWRGRLAMDDIGYLLLPLEGEYCNSEGESNAALIPCNCVTRCWNRPDKGFYKMVQD